MLALPALLLFAARCTLAAQAAQQPELPDHYDVLGVDRDATRDVIRTAHNNCADPELFRVIQEAWEVLGDYDRRLNYDFHLAWRGDPARVDWKLLRSCFARAAGDVGEKMQDLYDPITGVWNAEAPRLVAGGRQLAAEVQQHCVDLGEAARRTAAAINAGAQEAAWVFLNSAVDEETQQDVWSSIWTALNGTYEAAQRLLFAERKRLPPTPLDFDDDGSTHGVTPDEAVEARAAQLILRNWVASRWRARDAAHRAQRPHPTPLDFEDDGSTHGVTEAVEARAAQIILRNWLARQWRARDAAHRAARRDYAL